MTRIPQRLERTGDSAAEALDVDGGGMLICPKCRTTYSSSALSLCYRDGERLVDYARFMAVENDPLRGVLIGDKYRLIERVGQGGMGTIYRALQAGLNRPVAVKILKRELNVDRDTVARFHREANAMSLLTHPNTVRVYDFGQTEDGLLYLVMELLVGELITDVMARGPIEPASAVRMTQQILRSLGEAHRKAIVHRDLKPDNVFVASGENRDGLHGEPVIKVLDFGIAKVVAPDRRVDQFETQAGTVFGTPRYMSPEQAQGATLDGRSDLYSVGALLYQMLVGRAPFTDDDAVVVMAKHIQELPEPPSIAAPGRPIPKSLNDVAMRALAKDPGQRFQEAADFDAALEACMPDILDAAAAAATGQWAQAPVRRWLAWSYGMLAVVLFGAGYFGVRVYAKMNVPLAHPLSEPSWVSSPLSDGAVLAAQQVEPTGPVIAPSATRAEPQPARLEPSSTQVESPVHVEPPAVAIEPSAEATSAAAATPTSLAQGTRRAGSAVEVAIRSSPTGATVLRDGRRLGVTPLSLRVRANEPFVRIELRRNGFQPLAAELTAQDGNRLLALTPVRSARSHKASSRGSARHGSPPSNDGSSASNGASEGESTPKAATPDKPSGPYERFE